MKKGAIAVIFAVVASWGINGCIAAQERFWCNGATMTVQEGDTVWGGIEDNCWGNLESARNYMADRYREVLDIGDIVQFPNGEINP